MGLQQEIASARQKIVKDGFDMSVGELIRIYEKRELIINPVYQRSFRWDESRKTRFIESLVLGIPIPPIFVFTDESGRWELIDGLQRLSTIFEFAGVLRNASDVVQASFSPSGTKLVPSLNQVVWDSKSEADENSLPLPIRLDIERVRIRVEILKRESDSRAKYELFQRLNTGGAGLSPQEARNCVATMLNPVLFKALTDLSSNLDFRESTDLTERAIDEQKHVELVLRLMSYRYKPYDSAIDVHDWLDDTLISLAQDQAFELEQEKQIFCRTFALLNKALGKDAFKRCVADVFSGGFSLAAFEVIALGVSRKIDLLESLSPMTIRMKVSDMWSDTRFTEGTKAGTRGSTRLGKLLPLADQWFSV
jgi:hypothetical protein